MTLHTAKGLEYPVVFMVGMEDGILPHSRSIESGDLEDMEEERRLCYVGITRAKRRLYLVRAFRRSMWGDSQCPGAESLSGRDPTTLLIGMVNRQKRSQQSYNASPRGRTMARSAAGGDSSRREQSGYNWSSSDRTTGSSRSDLLDAPGLKRRAKRGSANQAAERRQTQVQTARQRQARQIRRRHRHRKQRSSAAMRK
jgi:DNA helicase-2/ATP-dependent DNA helicase PcrA